LAALRDVLGESVPFRYSREGGVLKVEEIPRLKKAIVGRPRSRKLQEETSSLFTRTECFHKFASVKMTLTTIEGSGFR
jgi:hypothetical protein